MSDILAINKVELTAEDKTAPAFAAVTSRFETLKGVVTDFGGTAQGVFAALGLGAFATLVTGAISAQAELSKLSERTGATVEGLSAMRTAAKYAGVDMENVATGLQRFSKNITEAQSGTGKAAEALKALGFNAVTFATQFKTTDQAMLAVAQRLNQYADGVGKTAIQQELLGKSGANLAVFLRELAERGLDNVKVTAEQARAAKELEDSYIRLKSSFTNLVNQIATIVVPILQKVVDSIDTFKKIGIAAIAAFVVWPAILTAASLAMVAYQEAVISAALATEVLGMRTSVLGTILGGIRVPAELAAGGLTALRAAASLLFAAFAGWQIGKWLSDNFLEARLFGIAFVDSMLTGWENIKFGAQVAWEFIKFAFANAVEQMKVSFGSFIEQVGKGLSYVPGLSDLGAQVAAFGQTLTSGAGTAVDSFKAKVAALSAENAKAKKEIHDLTDDMMVFQILERNGASKDGKPKGTITPPVPAGAVQDVKDLTSAINAYEKALAAVAKAGVDALAKQQSEAVKEAEADLERSYSRGIVAFREYWDRKTGLQSAALAIQEQQLQSDAAVQTDLVNKISAGIEALDPAKFKTYSDYQKAWYRAATDLATAQAKLVQVNGDLAVVQQKATQVGKDYVEVLIAESNGSLESIKALDQQIEKTAQANEQYGLTASQVQLVIAARNEEALAQARANGASAETIKFLEDEIAARQKLSAQLARGEDIQHQIDLVKSFDSEAHSAFSNILSGGTDTFKKIGESLKKFVIDVLYELTLKKWIISVGASLTGVATEGVAGALNQGSGAAGTVGSLISNGSSAIGGLGSLFGGGAGGWATTAATGTLADNAAIMAAYGGTSTAAGAATGIAGAAQAAALALGASETAAAAVAAAVPVVGWIAAAGILLYSIFGGKGGGPKLGGFASTDPGASRFFTPNEKDADLLKVVNQQKTGYESIIASLGGTKGNFNFALGFDTDPKGTAQNRVSAGLTDSSGNSLYNVRDRSVGRDDAALQAAVSDETARLLLVAIQNSKLSDDLTAVFGKVSASAMSSTEITNLIAGVEAIHIGLQTLGGGDGSALFGVATSIQDVIDAAKDGEKLTDTWSRLSGTFLTTDTLANVLGHDMGSAFGAVGLASTDAREQMIGFVGGLQNLAELTNSYYQNFFTAAERQTRQINDLGKQFDALGVSMPATRAAFRQLVESQDLSTEAGRQMVASLLQLAPAFAAAVTETDSLTSATNSLTQAQQQAIKSAQDFFASNFYSDAEKQAKAVADAQKQIADAAGSLGISIPQTVAGFRSLIEGIDQSTDAGKALYNALIVLAPAVFTLGGAATTTANQISQAAAVIQSAGVSAGTIYNAAATEANRIISNIQGLANAGTGDYGSKQGQQASLLQSQADEFRRRTAALLQSNGGYEDAAVQQLETTSDLLQNEANKAVDHLARYTVLSAQYSTSIAEQLVALQDWNTEQAKLFRGNADALAALATITDAKWKAIVQGTSTGVTGTIDQLQKLRDSIATYLTGLLVSDKSILTPQQKLDQAKGQYNTLLGLAQGGDQTALGSITGAADTYLTLARQFYASSAANTAIFNQITSELRDLAIPPGTTATTTPTIALQNALPTKGKLASSEDLAATNALLAQVITAVNANTAVTAAALGDAADQISGATDAASTKTAVSLADSLTTTDRR